MIELETHTPLLTTTELSQRWSFHPESLRRKIRNRELTTIMIGRRRLISLDEVLRVEREGTIGHIARQQSKQQPTDLPLHSSMADDSTLDHPIDATAVLKSQAASHSGTDFDWAA